MKRIAWRAVKGVALVVALGLQVHAVGVPYTVLEEEAQSSRTSPAQVQASTSQPPGATVEKLKDDERQLSEVLRDLQEDTKKLKASEKEHPDGSDLR